MSNEQNTFHLDYIANLMDKYDRREVIDPDVFHALSADTEASEKPVFQQHQSTTDDKTVPDHDALVVNFTALDYELAMDALERKGKTNITLPELEAFMINIMLSPDVDDQTTRPQNQKSYQQKTGGFKDRLANRHS